MHMPLALTFFAALALATPNPAPIPAPDPAAAAAPATTFETKITPGATVFTAFYWSIARTTIVPKATSCPTTKGTSGWASADSAKVCGAGCAVVNLGMGNNNDPWKCTPYASVATSTNKFVVGTTTCSKGSTVHVGTDLWGADPNVPQTYCLKEAATSTKKSK